jgi:hypothetical protein
MDNLPTKTERKSEIELSSKFQVFIPQNANITPLSRKIILAAKASPIIRDISKREAGEAIKVLFNRAIFESGMKCENPELVFPIVVKDIFDDFAGLTLEEIKICFKLGVRGKLGDFMGMNVRTFYGWLTEYFRTLKTAANKEFLALPQPAKEVTIEQKKEIHRQALQRLFSEYDSISKEQSEIAFVDYGNTYYNLLNSLGVIYFSYSNTKRSFEKARILFSLEHKPMNARNEIEEKQFIKIQKELLIGKNKDIRSRIKSLCKTDLFHRFLRDCKNNNINLPELIENAKIEKQWKIQ